MHKLFHKYSIFQLQKLVVKVTTAKKPLLNVSKITRTNNIVCLLLVGPRFEDLDAHIPVDLGSSVTLTCDAKGNPTPSIIWRRGDYPDPLSTDPQYTIHNIQIHDLGQYKCTASAVEAGFASVTAEIYLMKKGNICLSTSMLEWFYFFNMHFYQGPCREFSSILCTLCI